jgi:hypothetical protein
MPVALPLSVLLVGAGCHSPFYADRGAAFGGVAGAGVGALVGEAAADSPVEGAVIGSALGALTGAATGSALDEIEARNQALIQEQIGRPLVGAATLEDTVALSQAGLGDEVIIQHLRSHGFSGDLTSHDLIALKQQGVSENVIRALQELKRGNDTGLRSTYAPPLHPPVIVEEHYHGPPLWPGPSWPRPYYLRYRHGHRHHPSFRWGVSFGN